MTGNKTAAVLQGQGRALDLRCVGGGVPVDSSVAEKTD